MNTTKKVFYFLILIFISTIFLPGCGVFNLSDFVLPDDIDFISCIEKLNTPEEICSYIKENFTYEPHLFSAPNPYTLWKTKKGDCNDLATFAQFVANYHGYDTYQLRIFFKKTFISHIMAIFKENDKYTYLNIKAYYPINVNTFEEVVFHFFSFPCEYELDYYEIYDYDMNSIEKIYSS